MLMGQVMQGLLMAGRGCMTMGNQVVPTGLVTMVAWSMLMNLGVMTGLMRVVRQPKLVRQIELVRQMELVNLGLTVSQVTMVCQGVSLSLVMMAGETELGKVLDLLKGLENDCPPHYPVSLSCKVNDLLGLYLRLLVSGGRGASWARSGAA